MSLALLASLNLSMTFMLSGFRSVELIGTIFIVEYDVCAYSYTYIHVLQYV